MLQRTNDLLNVELWSKTENLTIKSDSKFDFLNIYIYIYIYIDNISNPELPWKVQMEMEKGLIRMLAIPVEQRLLSGPSQHID